MNVTLHGQALAMTRLHEGLLWPIKRLNMAPVVIGPVYSRKMMLFAGLTMGWVQVAPAAFRETVTGAVVSVTAFMMVASLEGYSIRRLAPCASSSA